MFGDKTLFRRDPRDYALSMVAEGLVDAQSLLEACLSYMSHDDVRDMLDCNELSPRFDEADEDEDDERDPMDDFNYVGSRHHY
jgi:hypothetical protein